MKDILQIDSFADFWALIQEVWTDGVFGVDIGQILTALAIFVAFLFFRSLFSHFVIGRIKGVAKRTRSDLDNSILDALDRPLRFVPVVIGVFVATSYLEVSEDLEAFFYNVNRSLVAFSIFATLYRLVTPVGMVIERKNRWLTDAMLSWLLRIVKVAFVLIGGAAILEVWGIEVGPLIAGLGLFGVAIALGAQDLFKNLIAGLFLISERRFNNGDWVLVEGIAEGTVETIGFRTTKIRRFDKAPVYVPNSQMADSAVTNFSRMTFRRIHWIIGVEYRTTKDQLETIRGGIETYIHSCGDFEISDKVSTFVRIDSFAASSIDILVYCFTKTTVWGEWLAAKERLALAIKGTVEGAGAGFAFPSQSLYVEQMPEGIVDHGIDGTDRGGAAKTAAPASTS